MAARLFNIGNKFNKIIISFNEAKLKIKLPDRFKGTIIEKWAHYWKGLGTDYREVFADLIKDVQTKPLKASICSGVIASVYASSKNNPEMIDFIDRIRYFNNQMSLVHEVCHNKNSAEYLKFLEHCINEGILRRLSIGIISLVWLDNYDQNVANYKSICPYTKVDYLKFHERIIDIGFWNRWYKLEQNMKDYDVNVQL